MFVDNASCFKSLSHLIFSSFLDYNEIISIPPGLLDGTSELHALYARMHMAPCTDLNFRYYLHPAILRITYCLPFQRDSLITRVIWQNCL